MIFIYLCIRLRELDSVPTTTEQNIAWFYKILPERTCRVGIFSLPLSYNLKQKHYE